MTNGKNEDCIACDDDWTDWRRFETWFWAAPLLVQLSMVAFLVVHGRKDKSFRQAFFIFFVAVTLVDSALVLLRTTEHGKNLFGTVYDMPFIKQEDPRTHEISAHPTIRNTVNKIVLIVFVPALRHAQPMFLTAIAATRFTAFAFPLKHASMWRTRTVVVVAVSLATMSLLLGGVYPVARQAVRCSQLSITQRAQLSCGWQGLWFFDQVIPEAFITFTSAICCVASFVLNIGSIVMLVVLRATGRLQRKGPELPLFVHSLCMFLLQLSLAFQDIVSFTDGPQRFNMDLEIWDVGFELSLGDYRHSTEWLAGASATRVWYKDPDGIRRLVLTPGCSPWTQGDLIPPCPVWYRLLTGELRFGGDPYSPDVLTLHTIEQCLLALSGSLFLLIISGNVRNAYLKFYFKWQCLKKKRLQHNRVNVIKVAARGAPMPSVPSTGLSAP